jgi:hypothetical protein
MYMAQTILIDELHVSVRAPRGLPDSEYVSMRRTLDDWRFRTELHRAVRSVVRHHPALAQARVRMSR